MNSNEHTPDTHILLEDYEECGRIYSAEDTAFYNRPEYPTILEWIPEKSTVLDLGSGDGSLGVLLRDKKQCQVDGVEIDPQGVASSIKKGIPAQTGPIDQPLSFNDNQFDYTIINVTLHMLYRPDVALKEAIRIGKKSIVSFPNFGFLYYRLEYLFGGVFPPHSLYGYKWYNTRSTHLFTYQDFLNLLNDLGHVQKQRTHFIGYNNRKPDPLANTLPNLFSRGCIIELQSH